MVKLDPSDWVTYTHDDHRQAEVDEVLADGYLPRSIMRQRKGPPYQFATYVDGLDDVIARKRRERSARSPNDYGYYDDEGCFQTPHERLGLEPGETGHDLDEREAWEEWLAPRKEAMDAALEDPATRPRWTRIFEAALQVGHKTLQQMEGFLATRGTEPIYSFPVSDILRNMTDDEAWVRAEEAEAERLQGSDGPYTAG